MALSQPDSFIAYERLFFGGLDQVSKVKKRRRSSKACCCGFTDFLKLKAFWQQKAA
jgi:hypothetical protein